MTPAHSAAGVGSLVFLSSEIEDGNSHAHTNMPVLLAGSAGGVFTSGRHIVYEGDPSVGQLFVSMLNALGVEANAFGDATAPLPDLI